MKLYDGKTFLATILVGGAGLVYSFLRWRRGDGFALCWVILFAILILRGLWISFTEEGARQYKENNENGKRARQALFGKWGGLAPYGMLILFGIAAALMLLFPHHLWIGMIVLFAAATYQLWLNHVVDEEMRRQAWQQTQNALDAQPTRQDPAAHPDAAALPQEHPIENKKD